MPIDAARVSDALTASFAEIGVATSIMQPRSRKNTEPFAWEYHVASLLLRLAEARRRRAIKAAVGAGVIFDHEKEPLAPGSDQVVYAGDVVEIRVAVATPASVLDVPAFLADLAKAGVKPALITRLTNKHTHDNRAPHKFTSSIVAA